MAEPWEFAPGGKAAVRPNVPPTQAEQTGPMMPWEFAPGAQPRARSNLQITDSTLTGGVSVPPGPDRTEARNLRTRQLTQLNRPPIDRFADQSRVLAQGIPVARNFVPSTDSSREMQNTFPMASRAAQTLAGAAATYPAAAAGMIASGPTALANVATQGGIGATTALADAYSSDNKPKDVEQAAIRGAFGFAGGAIPSLATRPFFPSGASSFRGPQPSTAVSLSNLPGNSIPGAIRSRSAPDVRSPELDALVNRAYSGRRAESHTPVVDQFISPALGAAAGYYATNDPAGLLLGAVLGRGTEHVARRALNSQPARTHLGRQINPESQAILNALGINSFPQLTPQAQNSSVPTLGQ